MRLVVTAFVTVDGVIEAPGFDEHRDGKNAWALRAQDEENQQYNKDLLFGADALLLGRKTYQIWAAFWPTRPPGEDLAQRLNEVPKYVVSTTLKSADWSNSTLISGDIAHEVARLKSQPGGELLVYGSADLVDELLKHDLIDEYRLLFYPVILGSGKHLFRDGIDTHHLRLVESRNFGSGIVLLTYQPEQEAPTSPYVDEYSWTEEQVRSLHAAQDADRVLATVLLTDIVESTKRASEIGDRSWRELIDRHDQAAQSEVRLWLGQLVKGTGDGVLATFDAPTRALRCAFGLHEACARLGLEMRAAVHTGEIERRGADIGGIGVHIAARILEQSNSGRVVVSNTVRELATGTDLRFTALSSVSLRGVPGQWHLFEAALDSAEQT